MSDTPSDVPQPKKKRGKMKVILLSSVAFIIVVGGSIGGTVWFVGGLTAHANETDDPNAPQLVPRDDVASAVVARARAAARHGRIDPHVFKPTYVPLTDQFTSNLRGGGAYVQMGLALLTYYDERVATNIETHKLAIRSAVLMTLAEQDPVELTTGAGKDRLREQLTRRINATLEAREGFGGIESVYFTNLLVQ